MLTGIAQVVVPVVNRTQGISYISFRHLVWNSSFVFLISFHQPFTYVVEVPFRCSFNVCNRNFYIQSFLSKIPFA